MIGPAPCGVRHLRLDEPPCALEAELDEKAVLAVFWWGRLPLGSRLFTAGELPVLPRTLRTIGADLAAPALLARTEALPAEPAVVIAEVAEGIEARAGAVSERVSVVICTRDRPALLARCLDSVLTCDPAPDEVIVVDNAPSTDEGREVCEARPGVTYVAEPAKGLSRARNTGVAAASGEILAFTDDDVVVERNWIEGLKAGFDEPDVASVTGLVLPASLRTPAACAFEFEYGGLASSFLPARFDGGFLDQPFGEAPPVWRIGAGANMAVRREALRRAGPFDVRLGAGASGCSEDSELWHRLLLAGYACRYEPAAAVHHEHRGDVPALRRQLRAYMRGHGVALFAQYASSRHPGNLVRALIGLPAWMTALAVKHALMGHSVRRDVAFWEVLGLIEAPFWWWRHRRERAEGVS